MPAIGVTGWPGCEPVAPAGGAGPRRCLDLAAGLYRAGSGAAHRRGPDRAQRRRYRGLVPEGSSLTVRINGARDGQVTLYQLLADGDRGAVTQTLPMTTPKTGDAAEARTVLQRPVHAEVTDGSRRLLGSWRIALIPDAAPQVEVDGDIAPTPTGAFAVPWRASDDYGVVGIDAAFRRVAEEAKPGQPAAATRQPVPRRGARLCHRAAER